MMNYKISKEVARLRHSYGNYEKLCEIYYFFPDLRSELNSICGKFVTKEISSEQFMYMIQDLGKRAKKIKTLKKQNDLNFKNKVVSLMFEEIKNYTPKEDWVKIHNKIQNKIKDKLEHKEEVK